MAEINAVDLERGEKGRFLHAGNFLRDFAVNEGFESGCAVEGAGTHVGGFGL